MNRVVDLRLAFPVLLAWIALAAVLVVAEQHWFNFDLAVVLLVCSGIGLLLWAHLPQVLSLVCALSGVLQGNYVIRRASHVTVKPWEQHLDGGNADTWAQSLRQNFTELSTHVPGTGGELLPGLSIGETSRVPDALDAAMKTVSLSHVTAVSGANCVIVTASVMVIAGWIGFPRWIRILCAMAALVLFVLLVTPDPSVVRAAVMSLIVMMSLFLGRPAAGIPLLAGAALGMLLWNPWWAVEYGFVLSVSATAGLLLFSAPLTSALGKWLPWWIASLVALPLSAQLMCQPFIMLLSPQLPTYGILANILATPATPLATIFGLVSCLLASVAPVLAISCLWIAWLPSQWIAATALTLSGFPYAQLPWPEGVFGVILAAILSVLIVTVLLVSSHWVRSIAIATAVFLILTTLVIPTLLRRVGVVGMPPDWNIAFCDVGQGDAIFLRSDGEIALIDTGSSVDKLRKCQRNLGIESITTLFLTHFDKDHAGAVSAVTGMTETAYVGPPEDLGDQLSLESLADSGTNVMRAHAGQKGMLGHNAWNILWPSPQRQDMDTGNDGSVTLYVQFDKFSAIFLGDLGREAQEALARTTHLGHVDVVKVAHHGSADQSFPLYEELSPAVAVLSVGAENRYGHPRKEIVDVLTEQGALTPRTDQDGMIVIHTSSSGAALWREHYD